jgi:hypothetical protein
VSGKNNMTTADVVGLVTGDVVCVSRSVVLVYIGPSIRPVPVPIDVCDRTPVAAPRLFGSSVFRTKVEVAFSLDEEELKTVTFNLACELVTGQKKKKTEGETHKRPSKLATEAAQAHRDDVEEKLPWVVAHLRRRKATSVPLKGVAISTTRGPWETRWVARELPCLLKDNELSAKLSEIEIIFQMYNSSIERGLGELGGNANGALPNALPNALPDVGMSKVTAILAMMQSDEQWAAFTQPSEIQEILAQKSFEFEGRQFAFETGFVYELSLGGFAFIITHGFPVLFHFCSYRGRCGCRD